MPPSIPPGSSPRNRSVPTAGTGVSRPRAERPTSARQPTPARRRPRALPPRARRPPARLLRASPRQANGRRVASGTASATRCLVLCAALLIFVGASWHWADSHITRVDALSGATNTPGETYLIVGSDSREGWIDDGTKGARTDTIMILHQPVTGPPALISIPRDSYVDIPGHGKNKINAAFAFGGPQLLVQTVEALTGLTVDHYLEVGFAGVRDVVNALGGVELCYDRDVNDARSQLVWTAGCHTASGATALAFSRMRYSDPLGDIGRTERQQQVVSAVVEKALSRSTLANPRRLFGVAGAGLDSIRVDTGTGVLDLARAAQVFNHARGAEAVTGTPPISSIDHRVDGVGSTVLLDPDASDAFWSAVAHGTYAPGTRVGGIG